MKGHIGYAYAIMFGVLFLSLSGNSAAAASHGGASSPLHSLPELSATSVCNFNGAYSGSSGFLYINNTGQCIVNYDPTNFGNACSQALWNANTVGNTYTCPDPSLSFVSTPSGGGGGGGVGSSSEYYFTLIYHNTVSIINATSDNPDNAPVLPLNNLFTLAGSPGYYYVSYCENAQNNGGPCNAYYVAEVQNLTVSLSASPTNVQAGPISGYVSFTNYTTGGYPYGSPAYTYEGYTVQLNGQTVTQSTGDYLEQGNAFTFYVGGTYTVTLSVKDANGDIAQASATVYVNSRILPNECTGTLSSGSCTFNTYESIITSYPSAGTGSFVTQQGSASATPVISSVLQYNSGNSGWMLTCPMAPDTSKTLSNGAVIYDTYEYFTSDNASFIGGDRCLAGASSLSTTATLTVNTNWNINNYATSSDLLQLSGVARGKVQDLGYSGESSLQGATHYNISSNYDTQSYIFSTTPAVTQQGLWTWHSEYADLNSSNSNLGALQNEQHIYDRYFQTYNNGQTCRYYYNYTVNAFVNYLNTSRIIIPQQIGNTNSKNYVLNNGQTSSPYTQSTNTHTSQTVCTSHFGFLCTSSRYSCAYQLWSDTNNSNDGIFYTQPSGTTVQCANGHDYALVSSDSATVYYNGNTYPGNNLYINVSSGAAGNNYWVSYWVQSGCDILGLGCSENYYMGSAFKAIGYTNTTILPYLLYNITMPTTFSNLNNKVGYLNLSYDIYSPHNYLNPNKYLEPFPTSTGSAFFATVNGKFGEYPLNVTAISNPQASGLSGQPTTHFLNTLNSTQVANLGGYVSSLLGSFSNLGGYVEKTIGNPGFISASPNDYIFIINYSDSCSGWFCASTNTKSNLYILRFVPQGEYNISNLQPDSVPFSTDITNTYQTIPYNGATNVQSAKQNWISEWKTYWNNTLTEQSANLYIIGETSLSTVNGGLFGITGGFFGLFGKANSQGTFSFTPSAITSDYANDVFLEGKDLNNGHLVMGYLLSNGTANETMLNNFQQMISNEFAVSPGGQYLYLASPNEGNITIFRSLNFTFLGNMSLAYENSTYVLNITKYLVDGGPYHSQRVANFYKQQASVAGSNVIDSTFNQHPMAISESDGVLYVLDNWTFSINGNTSTIIMLRAFTANDTEVPIDPSHVPDVLPLNPNVIATSTGYTSTAYPPYGWPLSANISLGTNGYISYCIANCTYTPETIGSKSNGYLPVGPAINVPADTQAPYMTSIYFSSNFNNTGYLLAHVGGFNGCPANVYYCTNLDGVYTEFLTLDMDISNYTSPSLLANMSFSCYLNTTKATANPCIDAPHDSAVGNTLKAMNGPLLGVPSSFKYAENLGSPSKYIVLSNIVGSAFPSANSTGSSSTSSSSGNALQGNSLLANEIVSTTIGSSPAATSALTVPQTFLKSTIGGYFIIPFNESYTMVQTWGPDPAPGVPINGGSCSPYTYPGIQDINGNATSVQTNITYGYARADVLPSSINETVEGGPTYVKYISQANKYYIPNISDANAILPPYLNFKIFTNRIFGEVYVNQSVSPQSDYQMPVPLVVNQTHMLNYEVDEYLQQSGGQIYPAYYTEESIPLPSSALQTGVSSGSAYYNQYDAFPYSSLIAYSNSTVDGSDSTFVQLYQIYHRESIEDALLLSLQGDSSSLGYNRLVYTFVDQFNNTIYMPLDADIANITSITLDPKTVVSPINANETTINVTGVAGYYPSIFSYLPAPLPSGSKIYIYYDTNINFYNASYSSQSASAYAEYQQMCAFSPNSICILADPANASQTAPAPDGNSFLTYPSFHTQYNSSGECSPEPKSLLNVTHYNCNIYGDSGLPETGTTASGNTEYCLPQFLNGTGTLTSQLGYVGTTTTNSSGGFSLKFPVCGTGTGKVIASYYGTPLPQPNIYHQTPLGISAQYSQPASSYNAYPEYTYTYAPNETSSSFPIGSYALSFGSIELPLTFAIMLLIIALSYKRRSK